MKIFNFKNIGIALLGILLALVICEVIVRAIRPQWTYSYIMDNVGSFYTDGEFIPFTLKANYSGAYPSQEYPGERVTISTNSLGLRSDEITLEKPAGVTRILMLGDSYTFGHYVNDNETYPAVLQRLLREQGKNVEVINAGYADGFETDQIYVWLLNQGLLFQPDIIVYGFFIGNDISGIKKETWADLDEYGLPTRIVNKDLYIDDFGTIRLKTIDYGLTAGTQAVYRIPLLRESHLAILINRTLVKLFSSDSSDDSSQAWGENPFPYILRAESDLDWMQEREADFKELVKGMERLANENDAEFLVTMIPVNFQVEPDFLTHVVGTGFSIQRDLFDEMEPWIEEEGIPYINILKAMQAEPGHYYPDNYEVHFNPQGNEFTAVQIAQFLDTCSWDTVIDCSGALEKPAGS